MLFRLAAVCLLTSMISVMCKHLHKPHIHHHHHHKHSKRIEATSIIPDQGLPSELHCWHKEDDESKPTRKFCNLTEDMNQDEFFAGCYFISQGNKGSCWTQQEISMREQCKPDCIIKNGLPFCCCTTENCNDPERIIYVTDGAEDE